MRRSPTATWVAAVAVMTVVAAGCASVPRAPAGDRLLALPDTPVAFDQREIVRDVMDAVGALLATLHLPEDRVKPFRAIQPGNVIRDDGFLELGDITQGIVMVRGHVRIAHAASAVIIATGSIHISHAANSIVVSGEDVAISHDGARGGSLVVSKGRTRISHASGTLIYAGGGAETSFARNVHAFNTRDRVTSWGHINNILIEPLFREHAP